MRRIITATMLTACLTAGCGNSNEATNAKTQSRGNECGEAYVVNNEVDLGTLAQGDVAGAKFTIRNNGGGDLHIIQIDTGCGCTKAEYQHEAIAPGAEAVITLIYDSSGFRGYQHKTATVTLMGCGMQKVKLAFTAQIEY